jgi:tRNA(Ile)-lysidine synthase
MSLEARFVVALSRLAPSGKLVAAVSGGGDSVAMLWLLKAVQREVIVAHLDHGLRSSSAEDAEWVKGLAARLGFVFEGVRVEVAAIAEKKKANLEATARELRYSFLTKVAKQHGAAVVLTAHTADDQAETVLMQLARGSTRATGVWQKSGRVIRPLLGFGREELRQYLSEQGRGWLEDQTNRFTELSRNYVRHEVLPKLYSRFPKAAQAITRFAEVRQTEEEWLEAQAQSRLLHDERWPVVAFRVAPILKTPDALRGRALRQVLEAIAVEPSTQVIERLSRATEGESQGLAGGYQARRQDGSVFLIPPGLDIPLPEGFRRPRPGDYLPMPFGRKRLVEFFAEHGVPPELRRVWPIKAEGSAVKTVWQRWPDPSGDAHLMRQVLRVAKTAADRGEVPVAALIVQADGSVGPALANTTQARADATAHAELRAIRVALAQTGQKVLPGSTLYVTLEPCPMCYGAALEAQVARIVWANENLKAGFFTAHGLRPQMPVQGGVLEQGAARLLRGFFAKLR